MTPNRKHSRPPGVLVIPLVVLLTFSASCATLFNPTTQNVPVTTHPDGGEVWVDGKQVGTAPLILKLDTRTKHDITVRRGDDIRTWQTKSHVSSAGASYLGADSLLLVPGVYCAVKAFEGVAFYNNHPGGWFDFSGEDAAIGIGCLLIGLTPLFVDVTTNHLSELQPKEITADFEQAPPGAAQREPQEAK